MGKKLPTSSMILDIGDKEIDVSIYLDDDFKALRYELTSMKEIDPMEAAFVLMGIAKSICEDLDVHPDTLFADLAGNEEKLH